MLCHQDDFTITLKNISPPEKKSQCYLSGEWDEWGWDWWRDWLREWQRLGCVMMQLWSYCRDQRNCDHIVMTNAVVVERCIALNAGVNVMVIKTIEATPVWRFTKVHLLTFTWICGAFCFWRSSIWIPLCIAWRWILVWYDDVSHLILIGLHNNSDHSQSCWWTLEIGSKNFAAEETQ